MGKKNAVVVGGLGIIGRHTIAALEADGGWSITSLSRRKPNFRTKAKAIQVDILDKAEAKAKLSKLTNTTHIFYSALAGGVEAENVEDNVNLVRNSVGNIAFLKSLHRKCQYFIRRVTKTLKFLRKY